METIGCLYTCKSCGIIDREVQVPIREHSTDDPAHWLKNVLGHAIGLDHSVKSPFCTKDTMDNVKIPQDGRNHIGGPLMKN